MKEVNRFPARLKELRTENGLTMKQLADEIEVSNAAVCKWENGLTEPKASFIVKIAEHFNCSTDFLLGLCDDFGNNARPENQSYHSKDEQELLRVFKKLSPEIRKLLVKTAFTWADN